jgi:hypothetical protein
VTIEAPSTGVTPKSELTDVNDEATDGEGDGEDDEIRDGTIVTAEIRRTEYDTLATANAISARGLPGDVYRAATVRTGKLVR